MSYSKSVAKTLHRFRMERGRAVINVILVS
ncbi:Uncharacterised protein [Vibrio cholerae]|nr:Uncharacterised protein [Vibrio cholerae]